MNAKTERLAHAYCVRSLRRMGRELTSGEWRANGEPMDVSQAMRIMARAFLAVMKLGIASAVEALDDKLAAFLDG